LINACSQTLSFDQDGYSSIFFSQQRCNGVPGTLLWPIILKHANYIKISYPGNKTMFDLQLLFLGVASSLERNVA
jgi:hypothetical protein